MSQVKYLIQGVVADGDLLSEEMSEGYERCYISVVFYSDEFITAVTPSAGTLTFRASETGDKYGTIPNGTVDATTDEYGRPNFAGGAKRIKATAALLAGATHYRATIHRFEG